MTAKIDLSTCSVIVNNKPISSRLKLSINDLVRSAFPECIDETVPFDSVYTAKFHSNHPVKMYNPLVGQSFSDSGVLIKGARFVFLENYTELNVVVYREPKEVRSPTPSGATTTAMGTAAELRKVAVYGALVAAKIQEMHRLGRSPVSPTCLDVIVGNAQQEAEQVEEALQRRMLGL